MARHANLKKVEVKANNIYKYTTLILSLVVIALTYKLYWG